MRIDKWKFKIACARACMRTKDVSEKAGVPRATISTCIGRQGGSPATIGKIARALNVDVTDIIEKEE